MAAPYHTLRIHDLRGETHDYTVLHGRNLREELLEIGWSPYTVYTRKLNCGGRGLCATCGVWLVGRGTPTPRHWHDRAAAHFGYLRLSCQITIDRNLEVALVDKWIWGKRKKNR